MKAIKEYYPDVKQYHDGGSERGYFSMNDINRMSNILEIVDGVIDSTDEYLLKLIYEGYESDIDKMFDDVIKETYRVLYGRDTIGKIKPTLRYLKEMNEALEEQLRRNSLAYFSSDVLGMEMNWHHLEWAWLVENFLLLCVLAARDHGKSFFFSHALPIWMMYKYDKKSKRQDILNGRNGYIFSNTATQAVDLMEIVKDSITDIDLLRERLYPKFKDNWSKGSIKTQNNCRLRVRGLGSTVRGAHPGYLILDDVLKDNALYSKVQRQRTIDYFNASILPMLIPGGHMWVVGTPFHQKDLYSVFRNNIDFAYREYPAIDKDNNLLWGSRHNRADLAMRKRIQGNLIFTREFLVKPIGDQSTMFPEKILRRSIYGMEIYSYVPNIESHPIKFKKVVTGCDFAISASVSADYTSFVTFGIDESENMWLLNLVHEQGMSFAEQKRALRLIWRSFKPDVMFLESNQFQKIYVEVMKEETSMPVKPFLTTRRKQSLTDGVPGLALLFENAKFRFPFKTTKDKAYTKKVLEEFENIGWTEKGIQGIGEHDDIVMSIWLARMATLYGTDNFLFDFIGGEDEDYGMVA